MSSYNFKKTNNVQTNVKLPYPEIVYKLTVHFETPIIESLCRLFMQFFTKEINQSIKVQNSHIFIVYFSKSRFFFEKDGC